MSRENKYRAWDKVDKRMAEVLLIDWLNKLVDLDEGVIERDFNQVELLHYTGLKDKNGVDIYEGDIIEAWDDVYNNKYSPFQIYIGCVCWGKYFQDASGGEYDSAEALGFFGNFKSGADSDREFKDLDIFSYHKQNSLLEFDGIKVLGNIYENPELLERSND